MTEFFPSQIGVFPWRDGLNVYIALDRPIQGGALNLVPLSQAGVLPSQTGMNALVNVPRVLYKSLTRDLVAPKFGMPLMQAAKELDVGVTTLKLWCRLHDISRWPYRKIQTIEQLKAYIEEFGSDWQWDGGKAGIIQKLEREKRAIEEKPDTEMLDHTLTLSKAMHRIARKKKRCN